MSKKFLIIEKLVNKIGNYIACGRDIKQIKTNFKTTSQKTSYLLVEGHQSKMNQLSLNKSYLKFVEPLQGNKSFEIFETSAAKLLIATRPHINSESILACETPFRCIATAFWEIRLKNEFLRYHPLILLWINSTFGFLLLLSSSVNSKAQIFKFKKYFLRNFPVPTEFEDNDLEIIEKLYEKIKFQTLSSFLDQFIQATHHTGPRYEIDKFFLHYFKRYLNIEFDLSMLYRLLINEPALTLTHYPQKSINHQNINEM